MNKIIVLSNEISINDTLHPFNTIYFSIKNDDVEIFDLSGNSFLNDKWYNFVNSANSPYNNIQSLIQDLKSSFV